jgi:hypothetical protein
MAEINLPISEKSDASQKETIILAGGVIDEKEYEWALKKLTEDKALQIADVHGHIHTDLMNLRIQSYEKRDMPSTKIDDAFRVISSYGNLDRMPKNFLVTREQINDLIYEMLIATQKNLPDGITTEDVANIWEQSIKNFHEILQSVGTTKETYEDIVESVKDFWRQFARTLQEKRKVQETK